MCSVTVAGELPRYDAAAGPCYLEADTQAEQGTRVTIAPIIFTMAQCCLSYCMLSCNVAGCDVATVLQLPLYSSCLRQTPLQSEKNVTAPLQLIRDTIKESMTAACCVGTSLCVMLLVMTGA